MTKEEFLKTIPNLEECFALYSAYTKAPYAICDAESFDDEIHIYTSEEAAKKRAESILNEQKTILVKYEKNSMLAALSGLYLYGINAVRFFDGGASYLYQLTEIIKLPDRDSVPEEKKPVESPGLQLTMMYFMQKLRHDPKSLNTPELRKLEEEMLVNVTRSRFLMPFKEVETEDGKKGVQFILSKINENISMIPVFTDIVEYTKFKAPQEVKLSIINFSQMTSFKFPEGVGGFVINPTGASVPISKEWLERVEVKK